MARLVTGSRAVRALGRVALVALCTTLSLSGLACSTEATEPPDRTSGSSSSDGEESDAGSKHDAAKPRADAGKAKPEAPAPADDDAGRTSDDKSPSEAPTASTTKSPWCAALAVLQDKCQSCHGATLAAGAPMSLVSYDDLTAMAKVSKTKQVSDVVKSRVHDAKDPMPPGKPLDAASLAAIDAWVAAGAGPGDDPTCAGQIAEKPSAPEEVWPPADCDATYKILAGNGKPVSVAAGAEVHPQFTMDAPWGNEDVQAVAFRPVTDNTAVLHHWILNGGGAFINGWAPGQDATERKPMPADVGTFLPKGANALRLDMHYNNLQGTKSALDQSGVEVCVTHKLRKYTATTFSGFAAIPVIGAGQEVDIVGTCNVSLKSQVFLLSESPHAHKLATHMKLVVKRAGMEIVLHDAPFAFDGQTATPLPAPFELLKGDQVITTCHFKNDTTRTVTFGEDTGNEMCFNFAVYYPKGDLSCGGAAPAGNPFGGSLFGG